MSKTYLATICAIALLGAGVVIFFSRPSQQPQGAQQEQEVATSSVVSTTEQSLDKRVVPSGMREYQNATYHFSLLYPQELTVKEQLEGGGATTIVFQNVDTIEGFQVFIVPYNEPKVSEQRFKQDEPSGVRKNLTNIVVDGATGAAFYSTNLALGDTREVWFVHGGFLYEVTTLKPLEAWFRDILQTWKFL